MEKYIPLDSVLAEIENIIADENESIKSFEHSKNVSEVQRSNARIGVLTHLRSLLDTIKAKEVGVWKTVDNINYPQADKNKIYCVFTKNRHILATVINHPKDEELLQWKCTEFPFHRYDMCEGDKYMQIV